MNRSIEKWAKIFDEEGHAEGFIEKMDHGDWNERKED